ncbi:MAG: flagellar FliJ family protein [Proteobacteria bacterium]|jgi:flagellar FliJ protein|nr:flagellar FliJ family protein [Pseudomonadota bacterium]
MNKFKLQTALKVRERLEKLYQKSFAEQVQVTQRLTDQLNILEDAFEENNSAVDLAKRNGFTIADLVRANGFGQRLKYHQSVVQDQMIEQQELMERRRQELVSATQQKRVLEILREKHELRERERLQKEETFELDEISLNLRRYRQES